MDFETAFYIFQRRSRIQQSTEILAYVDHLIEQESKLHEFEAVCYLHDCFRKAYNKSLKLPAGKSALQKITKKWKDYKYYVKVLSLFTEHNINPIAFFAFIVGERHRKGIPAGIQNTVTENAINHFLDYQKKNTYQVSTYSSFPDYEKTLYNQLNVDLVNLTAYLVRKPNVALSPCEYWMLSTPARILIAVSNRSTDTLTDQEKTFYEDLQFDPLFLDRVKLHWNKCLEIQISKIGGMCNRYRDQSYVSKLAGIQTLFQVLKFE